MFLLLAALAQGPRDSVTLAEVARRFAVPTPVMLAVALVESGRDSARGQAARGAGVGGKCREVGRMQIRPCGPWSQQFPSCRRLADYTANVTCGAVILRTLYRRWSSWPEAIAHYNGSGPASYAYQRRVLAMIGAWSLAAREGK